jgi:hypothetical protein
LTVLLPFLADPVGDDKLVARPIRLLLVLPVSKDVGVLSDKTRCFGDLLGSAEVIGCGCGSTMEKSKQSRQFDKDNVQMGVHGVGLGVVDGVQLLLAQILQLTQHIRWEGDSGSLERRQPLSPIGQWGDTPPRSSPGLRKSIVQDKTVREAGTLPAQQFRDHLWLKAESQGKAIGVTPQTAAAAPRTGIVLPEWCSAPSF